MNCAERMRLLGQFDLPEWFRVQCGNFQNGEASSAVPEIDASSGALALAAIAAATLLAWEIRRRKNA